MLPRQPSSTPPPAAAPGEAQPSRQQVVPTPERKVVQPPEQQVDSPPGTQEDSPPGTQADSPPEQQVVPPAPDEPEPEPDEEEDDEPSPARDGYAVEIRGVGHRFGDVVAINGISMGVPAGTMVGIIGPSGSGKTTTIRTMTGALAPEHGEIRVLGEDPRVFRRRTRERIGYMPQLFVLYPDLTTRENVDFVAALFGLLGATRRKRVDEVLKLVELDDARDRRASQLSGGMQRRLALASALVHEPVLLILDEPTAGIDPLLRQRVWDELQRRRDAGATLLVTTQYVTEAEYCDYVALISSGQLVAFAEPEELRREALGGEVLEIATQQPFDVRSLPEVEGVVELRQVGPNKILVIAGDVGRAGPQVVNALDDAGAEIEYSREYRPNFDEVFTALVTRHMQEQDGAPAGAGGAANPASLRYSR